MAFTNDAALAGQSLQRLGRISPAVFSDEALNDSDKTFDVAVDVGPAGIIHSVHVVGIRVEFTTSLTVGTRTFRMEVMDNAGDLIYVQILNSNLDVSDVGGSVAGTQNWDMVPGATYVDGTEAREYLPPDLWLKENWQIRIYDSAAIDAAADDMIVHIRTLVHWL